MAIRRLSNFTRFAWPVIEPATEFLSNWHIDAISEYLEAVTAGQITRLIVNVPPRYMKSISVSVMWPTWSWIKNPALRWIFSSYSQSLATKHSVDRRTVIESGWYQEHWSDRFQLAGDHNLKTEFLNDHRGHMISTSVGGAATGKGGDILVVDDPVNPKEAASDVIRESANTWFDRTFYSRLDNKKKGAIVVVMQRLHEKDLTGHLMGTGDWEQLKLPAEAENRQVIHFPMSGRKVERDEGDILWPEREGRDELEKAKRAMGSYGYAGQMQQDPSPSEGGLFKRQWWKFYRVLPQLDQQLQSWDCAFKETNSSDYVVGQVWGRTGANFYLCDQVRDRMNVLATMRSIETMTAKWPRAIEKLVEDKANGPAVIQMLEQKVPGLIAVNPEGGKVVRAAAVSPLVEAGNVWLPHPDIAPWVHDFIEELSKFPNGENDDQVDGCSQALTRLNTYVVNNFVLPPTIGGIKRG